MDEHAPIVSDHHVIDNARKFDPVVAPHLTVNGAIVDASLVAVILQTFGELASSSAACDSGAVHGPSEHACGLVAVVVVLSVSWKHGDEDRLLLIVFEVGIAWIGGEVESG